MVSSLEQIQMDRQHYFDREALHMDTSVLEEQYTIDSDSPPSRRRSKRTKRKWREIEALKAKLELERELDKYDFNFDLDEEE
jgi:hypothetical protein